VAASIIDTSILKKFYLMLCAMVLFFVVAYAFSSGHNSAAGYIAATNTTCPVAIDSV
jgi:hypothetical protein